MSNTQSQRELWLEKMGDHVLAHGLEAASLRPLAKAAGTSDRMLIYYFGDKAGLIAAILETLAARLTALMMARGAQAALPYDACLARTMSILSDTIFAPYMRLFLDIATRSASGDPIYARLGEQLGRLYFEWVKAQLSSDALDHDAARLMVMIEGMVVLNALGLHDICTQALVAPDHRAS